MISDKLIEQVNSSLSLIEAKKETNMSISVIIDCVSKLYKHNRITDDQFDEYVIRITNIIKYR